MKKLLIIISSPFMARHRKVERVEKRVEKYREYRQELFDLLSDLGCTTTVSDLNDVEQVVKKGLGL